MTEQPERTAEDTHAAVTGSIDRPPGFGMVCTVAWTELVQALRKDGLTVLDQAGPETRKWIASVVACVVASPALNGQHVRHDAHPHAESLLPFDGIGQLRGDELDEESLDILIEHTATEHGEMLPDGGPYSGYMFSSEALTDFTRSIIAAYRNSPAAEGIGWNLPAASPGAEDRAQDSIDARGGPVWMDRDQWGIVTDALIEHRANADSRKAANDASSSDIRADMCTTIIALIRDATAIRASASTTPPVAELSGDKYDVVLHPFTTLMRKELHANAGKGDRPGWLQMDRKTALLELYYHLSKLQKAMKDDNADGIREYGADVANMAMMAVDVCGQLDVTRVPTGQQEALAAVGMSANGHGCVKPDTDQQVFFYEQDFYVLSNFSAFRLDYSGLLFDTAEAAYHWMKFTDTAPDVACDVWRAPSAHEAFKIAERNNGQRRSDWDDIKLDVMRGILRSKVTQHEYVRRKLLATGNRELIEDSWRDSYWGWGPNRDGLNMLGKLWMELRTALRSAEGW